MPNTSNFGFDYESPGSLPGTTLTGGPTTSTPILAVQVDSALLTIQTAVSEHATMISTAQNDIVENTDDIEDLTAWTRLGTVTMSFSGVASSTAPVNFGFTFPGLPQVYGNIDSGIGATARWVARPISVTTTGCTMFVFSGNATTATWSDVPVNWVAHYRA